MQNKPNYYAVIPANVRYNTDLPPLAILLYGEITAFANIYGSCSADNRYFSELYGVSEKWIDKLLNLLATKGHITIHSDENTNRTINIIDTLTAAE